MIFENIWVYKFIYFQFIGVFFDANDLSLYPH